MMSNLRFLIFLVTVVVGAYGGVLPEKGGSGRLGIFNGKTSDITNYPYVVSVTYMGGAHCTGVIVNSAWVLSTGDCVNNYDAYYTTVMAGGDDATSGSQAMDTWATYVHPDYNSTTGDYNFGLIQVDGTFSWTDSVANISLPAGRVDAATWLTVVGYGESLATNTTKWLKRTNTAELRGKTDLNQLTEVLKEGKMAVVNNKKCEKLYKSDSTLSLTKRMGCAYNEGKTTVCDGDFGAPLVKDGVLYYLAASVASTGKCSTTAYPVVTADVYSVVSWINSLTGGQ